MPRSVEAVSALLVAALLVLAAANADPGLDYFIDAGAAVDALARGDVTGFLANQPLMGSLSVLLRAPFVAAVYHADERIVYLVGAIPCLAAAGALAVGLLRRMEADRRPEAERRMVLAAFLASPLAIKAIHWGHPEELLTAAFCVAAVLTAAAGRAAPAGVLLGCAVATKQWAVLAGVPVLLATPVPRRLNMVAVAAVTTAVFVVPLALGNPDRFMHVMRAAGSANPGAELTLSEGFPGAPVTPANLVWPLAEPYVTERGIVYLVPGWVGQLSHPMILLVGLALLVWLVRRGGRFDGRRALLLLALLLSLRGLLDVMSLDYYHQPLLMAMGAAAAVGTRRDAHAALLATAGLSLAFLAPAETMYDVVAGAPVKHLGYLAVSLPLCAWLARQALRRAEAPVRSSSNQTRELPPPWTPQRSASRATSTSP